LKLAAIFIFAVLFFSCFSGFYSFYGVVDVDLWCSLPSKVCFAGEHVFYDFSISYVGIRNFIDLELGIEGLPEEWNFKFVYGDSAVDMVRLMNGTRVDLRLIIDVPANARAGEYEFNVICEYSYYPYISSLACRIIVKEPIRDLRIYCRFPAKIVEAGSSISFDLNIEYFGPMDTFNLSILNLPAGWSASFLSGSDRVFLLSLRNGDHASIKAVLNVPTNASIGDYNLTFRVSSNYVFRDLNLIVRVIEKREVNRGLRMMVDYPVIDIEAGRKAYFTLTISNMGTIDELVYLNVTDKPAGWIVNFMVSGKLVHGLLIPVNGRSNVIVEIIPPINVKRGKYRFNVLAYSSDLSVYDNISLIVNVYGGYRLKLIFPEFPSPVFEITSGRSRSFSVIVENSGSLNVTNIYLSIDVPSIDWEVEVEPKKALLLRPGDSCEFKVKLFVSTIVSAGDYFITIKAISDQVSSSSRDIRVIVKKPVEWIYIGIGLALIVFTIVIFAFKKWGRR